MTTRDQFSIFNIFSPLGLLTILFLCSMSCSNRVEEKNANTREGLPDQESWKVTITLTDHGTIRSIVRSGHLEKYDDKQFILLD
ncbi:MAG: hypothetical protein QF794_03335, partial [Candidatus Marinimicrobia bacterium]|nr:hypothetical protein [Candidatus Neomarinimicrobiota bacterium]